MPVKVECRACRQRISGPFYGCLACSFYLHESCARLPRERAQNPFHPHHHLTLNPHTGGGKSYDVSVYECGESEFSLDIQRTSLKPSKNRNEDCRMIKHSTHPHQLVPFSVKMEITGIRCKACLLNISGEVYGCPDCVYFVHESCLQETPEEMARSLHLDHTLIKKKKKHQPHEHDLSYCEESSWKTSLLW